MISLHNARFTSLALLVSLVAAPFMVPTPALGANRMAVRAMQRGMQRRTLEYGFSLVDLIADNPWKSGLVAGGVIALIAYFASDRVKNPVNKGFAYVGRGFKKVGKGASSVSHQAQHQYYKRVKRYSDKELDVLQKEYRAAQAEKVVRQSEKVDAEIAFQRANKALVDFEKAMPHDTDNTEVSSEVLQQITGLPAEVVQDIQSYRPTTAALNAEYDRLQKAHFDAKKAQVATKKKFNDLETSCKEYDAILDSITNRRQCSRRVLEEMDHKLREISTEIARIRTLIDSKQDIEEDDFDLIQYNKLLKQKRELEDKREATKQQNNKIVNVQVPAPLQIQAPVAPQAHDRASEVAEQGLADRAFPVSSSSTGSSSSTSVLSSSSASSSSTSSSSSAALGSV